MELSGSNIERFLIFSCISGNGNPKKLFIFWKMELLSWSLEKKTTIHSEKISYALRKSTILALILKKFLYFIKRKLFLTKQTNKQNLKKGPIFWKIELSSPKFRKFRDNLKSPTIKNFLYFFTFFETTFLT